MHITSIFHCPKTADARECGYNLAQYNLSLIEAMLKQDPSLHIQIITSQAGRPLILRPSLASAVESGALTIRPLLKRNLLSLLSLAWRVRWSNCDVVHFQHETYHYGGPLSLYAFPFLLGWLRLWTHPVATLHHVVDPRRITTAFTAIFASRLPPVFIRWGFAVFYRLMGWMASSLIVHESCDRMILSQEYGLKDSTIVVIPHGADDHAGSPHFDRAAALAEFGAPHDAGIVYGFFSYFDLSKGIDTLIDEFLAYAKTHTRDVLIIAGTRNPYHLHHQAVTSALDALRARTEREGNGRIIWTGFLSPDRAMTFYHTVDCIIAPYRIFNGGSAAIAKSIGFRVPILLSEAFASCISNPAVIFSLQKHSLHSALTAFAESPERRAQIVEQIDTWRKERLWPSVGQRTLAQYRTLQNIHTAQILMLGAYGQYNLGDELLLASCLERLPRSLCVVASAHPSATVQTHCIRSVPSHLSFALLGAFFRAHTILVGGGDQFKLLKQTMGLSRHSLLLREAALVLAAKLLRKKVYLLGVGIGDLSTRRARFLTATILRLADQCTFRDRESARVATELAPHAHLSESADLAFLSQKTGSAVAMTAPDHPLVGIAPVFQIDHADAYPAIICALGSAAESVLHQNTETKIVFLPFQKSGQAHHDIITSGEILDHIRERQRCSIEDHLDLATVEQTYRSLGSVWGMRLHSLILACLYHVPFIALIYDVKVRKFLEEIDCAEWGIPLDASFSAEKLLALHRHMESRLPELREHLRAQAEKLSARAAINAQLLRHIAEECTGQYIPEYASPSADDVHDPFRHPTLS